MEELLPHALTQIQWALDNMPEDVFGDEDSAAIAAVR
jgi:hypothetical protein